MIETWDSLGLRATASHDVAVAGLAVPAEAVVDLAAGTPVATGPLYSFPLFGLLALSVSAVCTGIAVAALEDARAVASARKPAGSSRRLASVAQFRNALRPARQASVPRAPGLRSPSPRRGKPHPVESS